MCIKIEPEAQYNGRNMEEARESNNEFYIHGGVKQDLTEEMIFGDLPNTELSTGPQSQGNELIIPIRL